MNTIATLVRNGVRIIKFNKLNSKNSLSVIEFDRIAKILQEDASNPKVSVSVLTGSSDYFTSGLDINDTFTRIIKKDDQYTQQLSSTVKIMIDEIINYPKLLIAVVNGPAIGIGTTILPLCDYVYASKRATFQCPFVKIGLNVEACSSLTFPALMGHSKTVELVFLGKKIDVDEAIKRGLVNQTYNDEDIDAVYKEIENMTELPSDIVAINKKLIMDTRRDDLLECNRRETEMIQTTSRSTQFINTVNTFLSRKNKK